MNFKEVAVAETEFKTTGQAPGKKYILTPFSIPVPGDDNLKLEGMVCRPENDYDGYYYNEKHTKKKIVLHFTVGHLKGDILSLSSKSRGHVSTAFVVARDGTTYQLFSSAAWSYHLGRSAKGGNGTQSKISIGIEISNYGPLLKKGNELHTVYSSSTRKDVYCTTADTEQYIRLSKKYRGYQYYTTFTNEQYHTIIILLRYLTSTYDIPRKFVGKDGRFLTSSANSADFNGVTSHVNFRSDKVDIGPAFDWERVINGVNAEVYGGNPLEDALKVAEKKVEAAKLALETATLALATAEADLETAKNALEDSKNPVARSVSTVINAETIVTSPPKTVDEYGEDGPEPFDIDRTPFYI